MKPGAICFDATGTLIETARSVGESYHEVALTYGVDLPAWRLDDAFRRVLRHQPPRGLEGDDPAARRAAEVEWWLEVIRQTFQATDSTARFEDFQGFAQALFEHYRTASAWQPRPGAVALLTALERAERPLAVVSNFDHRLPQILEQIDLKRFFDSVEIPSEHGLAKTDRRLFERLATRFGGPIEALRYVGDDPPDVLAAISAFGVRVFDVRVIDDRSSWPDLLASPATLPPTS